MAGEGTPFVLPAVAAGGQPAPAGDPDDQGQDRDDDGAGFHGRDATRWATGARRLVHTRLRGVGPVARVTRVSGVAFA
ncbi:hypothetical protein B277_05993 [Janibacter hoylei PVAS-1]|uniref:Uncharacterized protein n=1 Tax=Janibacter hoylei PVAS-1 TaxID=1210046 RepID=K1DYS3_9MICO|nr:hypothetical protein B277_05993 [Janibacter hoylei PVAS-1]